MRHLAPIARLLGTVLAAVWLGWTTPLARQVAPLDDFDGYVREAMKDWKVPGPAVAIVKDGRVVFMKGYGVRELGKREPVDEHTLFAIGSTTKAMTAAALAMLVDDGKVKWNDPVTKHLPAFAVRDPYVTRELTVRDLLTHRSGVGNADFLWYGTDNSAEEILRRVQYLDQAASLRSRFIYQNVMYAAAGKVVGAASGMPWEQFIRARIFQPLEMDDSVPTLMMQASRENVASPHHVSDGSVHVIRNAAVDSVAPAGAVWSSVSDMSRWMRAMLNGGRIPDRDSSRLLTEARYAELFEPQMIVDRGAFYPTARLTEPHWTTYGLGWFQQDYRGRAVDFHTGSIDGMVAIIGLIRDERLGIYVLANLDHAELRHALMYKVFDLYGPGGSSRDWSADFLKLYRSLEKEAEDAARHREEERVAGTKPSLALAQYAGMFSDPLYGTVEVVFTDDRLRLSHGSGFDGVLEHWNFDTFRAVWDRPWLDKSYVTFSLDRKGSVVTLELDGNRYTRLEPASPTRTR